MIRQVALLRHAKSSWGNPQLDDFDRPLSKREIKDTQLMRPHIAENTKKLDLIISSASRRTRETAKYIFPKKSVSYFHNLYHADKNVIIEILSGLKPEKNSVVLIGHNPGLHDVAEFSSNQRIPKFPTCAVAMISFEGPWGKIIEAQTQLDLFLIPRDL